MNVDNLKPGSFIEVTEHELHLINKKRLKDYEKLRDAAPDLLDACIEALSLFDNYPECYESIGTYQVLNIAIAKAMGNTQ